MTTENTDAATRILTKAIHRLTARMTEADEAINHADSKRRGAEDELERVRVKLGGSARPIFEYFIAQRPAVRAETAEELAEKRMAELGELRQKLAELESLTQPADARLRRPYRQGAGRAPVDAVRPLRGRGRPHPAGRSMTARTPAAIDMTAPTAHREDLTR